MEVDTSPALLDSLINGQTDIVLANLPLGVNTDSFEIYPVGTESVKLLVIADHPLAAQPSITMADLLDYDWIIQTNHSSIGEAVESAFRKSGTPTPRNLIRTSSYLAMIAYLGSSTAITPVTNKVSEFLTNGTFGKNLITLTLPREIIVAPYYLIQVKGRLLSPIARSFKSILLKTMESATNDPEARLLSDTTLS